jgi:hypothetical protein
MGVLDIFKQKKQATGSSNFVGSPMVLSPSVLRRNVIVAKSVEAGSSEELSLIRSIKWSADDYKVFEASVDAALSNGLSFEKVLGHGVDDKDRLQKYCESKNLSFTLVNMGKTVKITGFK